MSKIIGVAVVLVIVKGGEIIVLYHTLPILRRLWEKPQAADRLTPARIRRAFRRLRPILARLSHSSLMIEVERAAGPYG